MLGGGGKYVWLNEGEIRLLAGPEEFLTCDSSDDAQIYISNDPGSGLTGDSISNAGPYSFDCERP